MTAPVVDDMSRERWHYTHRYLADVFGAEDAAAIAVREGSERAGLRPIAITSDVGRLLTLLARLAEARTALEVGTLGGYSALYIVRGLPPGGRLITIEADAHAAAIARENLARAGEGDRVRIEVGAALDVLPRLAAELGPGSVQMVFLDAEKKEYEAYWSLLRPLLAEGGLLVADNVLGSRAWWIDDEAHESRSAVDRFNRALAADPALDVAGVFARQGLLLARRRRTGER